MGIVVPFGHADQLTRAIAESLGRKWDRDAIVAHAEHNNWDGRVTTLVEEFGAIVARYAGAGLPERGPPPKPSLRS